MNKEKMKPLEEMDVIDNFLFTELVYDEETGSEVCRIIRSDRRLCITKQEPF